MNSLHSGANSLTRDRMLILQNSSSEFTMNSCSQPCPLTKPSRADDFKPTIIGSMEDDPIVILDSDDEEDPASPKQLMSPQRNQASKVSSRALGHFPERRC